LKKQLDHRQLNSNEQQISNMSDEEKQRKRYITKKGYDKQQALLRWLVLDERPKVTQEVTVAAAHGDRSENYEYMLGKRKLRQIDGKIHRLQKQLASYEVVDPSTRPKVDKAFFGATVTLETEEGEEITYQIMGSDELEEEVGINKLSYEAPLGRALLGKREGDDVVLKLPTGNTTYILLKVEWR
jgi:transcription elongation factor GreB